MADMQFYILDQKFEAIKLVDNYESFIWTDRYNQAGDFEIFTSADDDIKEYAVQDNYIWIAETDRLMIIETIKTHTDSESGNQITITGRSLESILDRRIVWQQTNFAGNLQNGIKKLLTDAIMNPAIPQRKINNFIFEESTDPNITRLTMNAQFTGDNLYDVIVSLCQLNNIGFKITLNTRNQFVFKLYCGTDRSYAQMVNPFVVFSPNFENIINSDYLDDKTTLKNITLVAGQGEGVERITAITGSDESGLSRRELFTDARDISTKTDDDVELTPEQYNQKLIQRGNEKLAENKVIRVFDGKVDTTIIYKYDVDFFLGDVVQTENDYGKSYKARIIEIIFSQSTTGYSVYPSFSIIDE